MINHCCMCDDNKNEVTALKALVREMAAGLDKLARLGNEPYFGNSVGNSIAREILSRPEVQAIMKEVEGG
jgi:hypothetical protein